MNQVHWLFVDLNSYFASVEQQMNPKLRGKPVAVVPMMADSTCCLAASYEAKYLGIKTGTSVRDAKRLCPEIVLIAGNHENYIEYHHKIVEAVESCVPVSVISSIDEMACHLMGSETILENAIKIGHKVKAKILSHAGEALFSSVGLAPNRYLAKIAADMKKPNGLTVLLQEELPHKLLSLKLRDFPGIGSKMEKRLALHGISNTQQLVQLSKAEMRRVWGGINGEFFWAWIRGEETKERASSKHSIGHSHVLPPELRTREESYLIVQKLLHKAAARLRKESYWCARLSLSVQYVDRDSFEDHISFLECNDDITLLEALQKLWRLAPRFGKPLKIGIALSALAQEKEHTLSLFHNYRREQFSNALDKINARFGKNTLTFASLKNKENAAPTRIAFSNIPELDP